MILDKLGKDFLHQQASFFLKNSNLFGTFYQIPPFKLSIFPTSAKKTSTEGIPYFLGKN